MGDASGDICAGLCGGCCLFCFSGLGAWCTTQYSESYGSRGCGGNSSAGCCGRCCSQSFDEDAFDEQVKKDMEKTRDPNAPSSPPKNQQMAPTEGMSAPPRTSQEEQRQIS
ncbi:hypothetical protein CPC08DRAFT_710119 [Agrocybe pediades]|nr:hypothetical protein CPC08DRAFT_710119 [Agrocybe pediades]